MAKSTSSQHRAQLIREMSKDMNKTRNSSASSQHEQHVASPQPTISDFDPENEAMMSTRQLDDVPQALPELRASAQKYRRRPTSPESEYYEGEYYIDTSAMARAFPDFTQGSDSSPDNSNLSSFERARGSGRGSGDTIAKLVRPKEHSSNPEMSLEEDTLDRQEHFIGNYQVMYTPPLRQRRTSRKTENASRDSLRRDAQIRQASGLQKQPNDPSPPPVKTKDSGSEGSRKTSGEDRRTLASMHARVRDENDKSFMSDARPPTIDLTARNTRFANSTGQETNTRSQKPASKEGLPTRFTSAQTLLGSVAPKNKGKSQGVSTPTQGTQQSFKLPTLPNLTELVSGVFEDGTPVFSRDGKPRNSRFVTALQQSTRTDKGTPPVDEIELPMDEHAIFLNIKLLQDKVATLERHNAEAANTIDEIRRKNRVLEEEKAYRQRASRSDSALGTTDSDGGNDTLSGHRKLLIEKNRLQSSVRALETQVDASNRKAATAETILKNITQERDSAVSQLGVAYFTIEQLKGENEGLREENNDIKARIGQLTANYESETQRWTAKEEALQRKLDRRTEAVKTMMDEAGLQSSGSRSKNMSTTRSQGPKEEQERNASPAKAPTRKDMDTLFDLSGTQHATSVVSRNGQQVTQIDDTQDSQIAASELRKGKEKAQANQPLSGTSAQNDGTSKDLTYLSFVDSREIAELRKTLEQERLERKQREGLQRQPSKGNKSLTQTGSREMETERSQQMLPRKSSMKDLTARSLQKEPTEQSINPSEPAEHNRRHSEPSILSIRSRRRGLDPENMTSAFIVPDITIRNLVTNTEQIPAVTEEAQKILDELANLEGQKCTVCKRFVGRGEYHDHAQTAKETIKIPKPVPVSERMSNKIDADEDHTIRPSQAPGLALATVIKGLEDELAHLKIQLSRYQTLFNGQDPALSKRSRKSVQQKMGDLLQTIDVKADQIYALYDVLEGQKQDGHEISDEEVEISLQSIGVDINSLQLRGGEAEKQNGKQKQRAERQPWDLDSEAESDDLPWEGIESTVETTKSSFSKAGRRRNSAT